MECREIIMSEEFGDFILPFRSGDPDYENIDACRQFVDYRYQIVHFPLSYTSSFRDAGLPYYSIPKLFTPLSLDALEASKILTVQRLPALNLTGKDVIIGFIDTGIDYTHQVFQNPGRSSRIFRIWDQTGQEGEPPENFLYGTEYTQAQISQALASPDPLSQVPVTDETGHGTYIAGIAAGSEADNGNFIGAAPDALIVMVKLKPAKQYLRDYFRIRQDAVAYQETDIMMGLKYLEMVAASSNRPLVTCICLGTNQGSHQATSPLSYTLDALASLNRNAAVVAAGNEAAKQHHYLGNFPEEADFQSVELRVGENETGFTLELWAFAPEVYTVGIVSPSGEVIDQIPARLDQSQEIRFVFEPTRVFVEYESVQRGSGHFLVQMRFSNPSSGIWNIRVYNNLYINGEYHIWLPITGFISDGTYFLQPDPYNTITVPSATPSPICTACYNHQNQSLYLYSGRGYALNGYIKPDLAAPGVNISGPRAGGGFTQKSGTSISAAYTAGAAAQLMEWAVTNGNQPDLNSEEAAAYLLRGADRSFINQYPNREWGYGTLNMLGTFEAMTNY